MKLRKDDLEVIDLLAAFASWYRKKRAMAADPDIYELGKLLLKIMLMIKH